MCRYVIYTYKYICMYVCVLYVWVLWHLVVRFSIQYKHQQGPCAFAQTTNSLRAWDEKVYCDRCTHKRQRLVPNYLHSFLSKYIKCIHLLHMYIYYIHNIHKYLYIYIQIVCERITVFLTAQKHAHANKYNSPIFLPRVRHKTLQQIMHKISEANIANLQN